MLISRTTVDKLGGPRKMAAALDRDQSTVWRWLNISFSGDNLEEVQELCRQRGLPDNADAIIAPGKRSRNPKHKRAKKPGRQTPATSARKKKRARSRKASRAPEVRP